MSPASPLDPDSTHPMEAFEKSELPGGDEWQYEPKWDGFRCLAFRRGRDVELRSKSGKPLGRYFPDVVEAVRAVPGSDFVVDGELVVPVRGRLSFDDLLMRIHPAASRVKRLSEESPATYVLFDLLQEGRTSLVEEPLSVRRERLEAFAKERLKKALRIELSPSTTDRETALGWLSEAGAALDGVVAKRLDEPYRMGERAAMVKVKRRRTADCVVGGFRRTEGSRRVGSLLLGLYGEDGLLHHVGVASSIPSPLRKGLEARLEAIRGGSGFTGRAPGGPSRWTGEGRTFEPVEPVLVVEVEYDHVTGERFRHGTRFLRWRPDKDPKACTLAQIEPGRLARRGMPGASKSTTRRPRATLAPGRRRPAKKGTTA